MFALVFLYLHGLQSTSKKKVSEFRKTSREIFPELTGLMFNEPKMTEKISVECPVSFYAFKDSVCSKLSMQCIVKNLLLSGFVLW